MRQNMWKCTRDPYSEEEPMKDINIEPQILVTEDNLIETSNDTVEISTDPLATRILIPKGNQSGKVWC